MFFHTNPHKPDRPQHSASRSVRLRPMSNHTFDLVDAAVSAARRGWRGDPSGNGCSYTKAGVILDDLLPEADRPAMLFEPARPRDARLTDALDAINCKCWITIPQKCWRNIPHPSGSAISRAGDGLLHF